MTIGQALERAQGGNLFASLARMIGISASDCRKALEGLCPAIAARLQETGRDPWRFEQLLDMLDDDEGDLLADGDPASRDVDEDGRAVLLSVYGSESAAHEGARATAKALRLDENAVVRLMPVAAALVLAVLAKRQKELAGPLREDESEATGAQTTPTTSSTQSGGGILSLVVTAIGAGIARAVMNRLRPRRRRRYTYARPRYGSRTTSRRRRRSRQPSLDEIFRGLIE